MCVLLNRFNKREELFCGVNLCLFVSPNKKKYFFCKYVFVY